MVCTFIYMVTCFFILLSTDSTLESVLRKVVQEEINFDRGGDDDPQSKKETLVEAAVLLQHRQ